MTRELSLVPCGFSGIAEQVISSGASPTPLGAYQRFQICSERVSRDAKPDLAFCRLSSMRPVLVCALRAQTWTSLLSPPPPLAEGSQTQVQT